VSARLQRSVVAFVAALLICGLVAIAVARSGPGTGSVRAVIGPGTSSKLVDVALIDGSGEEDTGNNRGVGQSETLPLIPAGRVQVNVGACSTPTIVEPGRTVTVRFDARTASTERGARLHPFTEALKRLKPCRETN
jgi:hypothetical protein